MSFGHGISPCHMVWHTISPMSYIYILLQAHKKKYTWMSLHMCHGMMPISIYAMPWHSCMKQPFFGHLKKFLLSSVIFIIFNFFLHSNYILVSIHNRLANLFWKFKWKLSLSIVVYSHFSQWVNQSGLRLVKILGLVMIPNSNVLPNNSTPKDHI